ncbi:hypothetical protein K469DRAFT_713484 [Zopfia rhizophila CBS 207.26]|uniref:F-box domain-containing protein n=1 Tax=Zopfia rhizophila CBS 207.26 TaxID=1314779 RepID=A0A6A6DQN3_9PEZI|nr:hypothetical protein K469DRAFT_713484 [Zopfia rhizophila CBS 207.26]
MKKPISPPIELVLHVVTGLLPDNPHTLLPPSHPTTEALLAFTLVCQETRQLANRYLRDHCVYLSSDTRLRSLLLSVPCRSDLLNITSLFLAPFRHTVDDLPTATWVRELLFYTSPSLKRLIIDIPPRSLYPDDDHLNVRPVLREAFVMLEHLEEFVSVRDELYLDTVRWGNHEAVWRHWPRLRRLALYNVDATGLFWIAIAKMQELGTLVLTHADGLEELNIKASFFHDAGRPLKILLVNAEDEQPDNIIMSDWNIIDPRRKMNIMLHSLSAAFTQEDPIEACQEYIKAGAETGTLWDWEGELLEQSPLERAE